jgi:cytosine/adenosine deaminase-related metal-dependent hydrolase
MPSRSRSPQVFHADAVVTGDREPVRDGAIVVGEGGVIADVGPAVELLPRHAGADVVRVRGVVLPGLVNAHTHVELSALRGQVPGGAGFLPWVDRLIGARVELDADHAQQGIDHAVAELLAAGTAAVGEVSNGLRAVRPLARVGIGGCVFHEIFGWRKEPLLAAIAKLASECDETVGLWPTTDLAYAPAPHTLYTTHPDGVRAILSLARARSGRSTLHLAEHAGERRALEHGDGPVAEWIAAKMKLSAHELQWPKRGPIDEAEAVGALAPDVLLVHLTDATPTELEKVAKSGAPVVLCPRSNLFIDLKLPPLLAVLAAGIEPALGTDSLASNGSLDVLSEAQGLAVRFGQSLSVSVTSRDLVQMATWNGARALGRPDLGRIARGAKPGLFSIDAPRGIETDDVSSWVLMNVKAKRGWLVPRPKAVPS